MQTRPVPIKCAFPLLLECVFDLLPSLLEVALHLVGLALGLELVVACDLAGRLLHFALRLLGAVLGLVGCRRGWVPHFGIEEAQASVVRIEGSGRRGRDQAKLIILWILELSAMMGGGHLLGARHRSVAGLLHLARGI